VVWSACVATAVVLVAAVTGRAEDAAGWSGNFVRNPGFEEDFVNSKAEPHVLSFKGDWFYNQQDHAPDYWTLPKGWTLNDKQPHEGRQSLILPADGTAIQIFPGAVLQEGGSAWQPAPSIPMKVTQPDKLPQPWRASVWCRGGGTLSLGGVEAKAKGGAAWEQVIVECPADKAAKDGGMTVTLSGPGEFDDLVVQEKLAPAPNLLANGGFEAADAEGRPAGFSPQKKFDWIGPTYYVWTDWMHFHEENRGPVRVDPLVFHGGRQSLRFDVYPGDEKFVESDPIVLNQDQPHLIEVAGFVRADSIKMLDIRCVDDEGANWPCTYPIQPEWNAGGSALFGNGTFGWRYVRKYFAPPFNAPAKAVRIRLAARGFNGSTLDDSGTKSYAVPSGTVWWDDFRVVERTSLQPALQSRGVKVPPPAAAAPAPLLADADVDLGERLYGDNELTLAVTNPGAAATFRGRLTTTLPDGEPVTTESTPVAIAAKARGVVRIPYRIDRLAGDFKRQGSLRLEVLRDGKPAGEAAYAFNTWPVVVDIDIARHYNLPNENPVTTSLNLGVAKGTLAKVASLELELRRAGDGASLGKQVIANLPAAFAETLQKLPQKKEESFEFNLPVPSWWADHRNLLVVKLDLGQLKVWPHDNPTRDTVLRVRGLDAAGKPLFEETSDGICRVAPPPPLEAIQSVAIRDDGAMLINNKPRYLMGGSHQNQRLTHTASIMAQLGLMGPRLAQGPDCTFENLQKMWKEHHLYALQTKPVSGMSGITAVTEMTPEQRQALTAFAAAGGMQNVVSINTGGWEATINFDDAAMVQKHKEVNDFVRQVTKRPVAISTSGAFNAWWLSKLTLYDINHAETEMCGPMDFDVVFTPAMKKAGRTTAWVYLPQLYDNTPYERYRFETYENIIRGAAGLGMIQGIGDPTFNRGLAGELRGLEEPLHSRDAAPAVTFEPNVSHMVRQHKGKTYILATNCGPIIIGNWKWDPEVKHSGAASHEGDSVNRMWRRPAGMRIHGFRGLPMAEPVKKGDKIVQHVWLDPKETPEWVMVAVRGDGRFSHCGVLGPFAYEKFREDYGNVLLYSELEHAVWHDINWIMDPPTYDRAVRLMGKAWADGIKKEADKGRATVDAKIFKPEHFQPQGNLPAAGTWTRIEIDAEKAGLAGKLVDGFAYLTKNGRALWDHSVLERDGKVVRVFCEDSVGIDRSLLPKVRIAVPGMKAGKKVKVLYEDRTITADDGGFTDDFTGVDTYGFEAGGVVGDMFGYVKDDNRELPRMIPGGYGYTYGPTAVHIYEIDP
jgi:hypothetical protein